MARFEFIEIIGFIGFFDDFEDIDNLDNLELIARTLRIRVIQRNSTSLTLGL